MKKAQTKNPYIKLENILATAGLLLIVVACIANAYSAYINAQFIHEPLDALYYFRYIILLGGGFAIGYFIAKRTAAHPVRTRLFSGVLYALLAMTTFWLTDLLRLILQKLASDLSFPWGKIIFFSTPIVALILTLLVAYVAQARQKQPGEHRLTKIVLIFSFVVSQLYYLASDAYYTTTGAATYDSSVPVWLSAASYLTIPIVIAGLSYLLLGKVTQRFDRLFYAILIGVAYSTLTIALWEFRTDATNEATNIFAGVTTTLTLVFVGVLLWRARKAL